MNKTFMKFMLLIPLLLGFITCVATFMSCGNNSNDSGNAAPPPPPPPPNCTKAPGVAFQDNVLPVIQRYCVSCHGAGDRAFTTYAVAVQEIDQMIFRLALPSADARRMPRQPNEPLDVTTQKIFSDWKANGLKERSECIGPPTTGVPVTAPPSLDYYETAALNDTLNLDEAAVKNTRYLLLGHRMVGKAASEDKTIRDGVSKAANGLSQLEPVYPCQTIDPLGTMCRIDLRAYGLSARDWDKILAFDKVKLESFTKKGVVLKQRTGTNFPWLHGENFVFTTYVNGDLYYDLLRIRGLELGDILRGLGVNFRGGFIDNSASFVGLFGTISNNKNRLLSRHESRDGYLWLTFDTLPTAVLAQRNLFQFPLIQDVIDTLRVKNTKAYQFDAQELIATLPNKLQLYALFNGKGQLLNEADPIIVRDDRSPFSPIIKNALSCSRCHSAGLIPAADQIRASVANAADQFDPTARDAVSLLYKDKSSNDAHLVADQKLFAQAMNRINVPVTGEDPLNALTDMLQKDMSINDVAWFLFLSAKDFRTGLDSSAQGRALVGQLLTPGGTVGFAQFLDALPVLIRDLRVGQDPLGQG